MKAELSLLLTHKCYLIVARQRCTGVADTAQRLAALASGIGGGALADLISAQPATGGPILSGAGDRPFEYELQVLAEQVRSWGLGVVPLWSILTIGMLLHRN
jgi:hypothetical protein